MRVTALPVLVLAGLLLGGCARIAGHPAAPTTLGQRWMFGIDRMRGDPLPLLPYTNRFLANLAAMPRTQVVFTGTDENKFLFDTVGSNKLRVLSWLRGEGNCMEITYTVNQAGQQAATFGLVIVPLPAGPEPDSACVDRAASDFYRALVLQGL